jgi:hypothetical protein
LKEGDQMKLLEKVLQKKKILLIIFVYAICISAMLFTVDADKSEPDTVPAGLNVSTGVILPNSNIPSDSCIENKILPSDVSVTTEQSDCVSAVISYKPPINDNVSLNQPKLPDKNTVLPDDANEIAVLSTGKKSYSLESENTIPLSISNLRDDVTLMCPVSYILEKKDNDKWTRMLFKDRNSGFILISLNIDKGTVKFTELNLNKYQNVTPGLYRIKYEFNISEKVYNIECEFTLTE